MRTTLFASLMFGALCYSQLVLSMEETGMTERSIDEGHFVVIVSRQMIWDHSPQKLKETFAV